MLKQLSVILILACLAKGQDYEFPENFKFGVATASYQVEGAWNVDGKSDSIWDWFTHSYPEKILDGSNGDDACKTYYKTSEDVQLLKELKVNFYRFSISWPRIFPSGHSNYMNQQGFDYYNNLIDELLANDIEPIVTMFHWDLPYSIHELGGWTNSIVSDYFADYARHLFRLFGRKVKTWITFNEPHSFCHYGYSDGRIAPAYSQDGIGGYLCGHTVLLSHAKAYKIYNEEFRDDQNGEVGISLNTQWYEPESESLEDIAAARTKLETELGWFAHPIFSDVGDYPINMKDRIIELSEQEGFRRPRLPYFTPEEIELVRGSSDFFGINHYSTKLCRAAVENQFPSPSYDRDTNADCYDPDEPNSPLGFRSLLNWIKTEYNDPIIFISENGAYTDEILNDCSRVNYYNGYLEQVLVAIQEDGCRISAYTAWSFMDNFEWIAGYQRKYGLHSVDFDDPDRLRVPRQSAKVYTNIIQTRKIDRSYTPTGFRPCSGYTFPANFEFGVATAAYQIEGAWNTEGKGESIWDHLTHNRQELIVDGSNGNIACDAYHKTEEDVQILADLHVNVYRFSLSWSRLLPGGHANYTNPDGIRYYNELINALLEKGIKPMITLFHWDLPQPLQEIGGWPSPYIADLFVDYAEVAFSLFGNRVKEWITFNEPYQICADGYSTGTMAPAYTQDGIGGYLCGHTLLKAHAKTYRLYEERYKPTQNGKVGITVHGIWAEPETDSADDRLSADTYVQMYFGWFVHPIFSETGDYPQIMKDTIRNKSAEQGFSKSRLPEFTDDEIQMIKGTADFLGLNHYTSTVCSGPDGDIDEEPSHQNDRIGTCRQPPEWDGAASAWLKTVPWGFRKMLKWIKDEYDNPQVIITENGFSDTGELRDCGRINYYNEYLGALLEAIYEDECNVTGYLAWSLMDNFEWFRGYRDPDTFPDNFLFGVTTSAYQIEGAWDVDGKGESIWDRLTHTRLDLMVDGMNGDVACDSYHKTQQDIQLLVDLGVNSYRFSLSWSRLLPGGHANYINPKGLSYYNELIDALVENHITPIVTLFYWDLPQTLQEIGGWPNPLLADIFTDYADIAFKEFGDRVKHWITFSGPYEICAEGYSTGQKAPAYNQDGIAGYMCGHTVIMAHAKAYRLYEVKYKRDQGGKVGMAVHAIWAEPETDSIEDQTTADTFIQMHFGWLLHPIYSANGDYPLAMKERIEEMSQEEGFRQSRLTSFTNEEIEFVRGTGDFIGLNHYTSVVCAEGESARSKRPSFEADRSGNCYALSEWGVAGSSWGLKKILNWTKNEYNNPEIIVTENGYSDIGELEDCSRIEYLNSYLEALLEAVNEDGSRVTGYFIKGFMDNFEWFQGYTERFGLYQVDFRDPYRKRTKKMSAGVYSNIIRNKFIDSSYNPEGWDACKSSRKKIHK